MARVMTVCSVECGTPMDPTLTVMGLDGHPGCLDQIRPMTSGDYVRHMIYVRQVTPARRRGLTGSGDNATQRSGAEAAIPTLGTRRRQVFDVIVAAGPHGVTHAELSELTDRSYSLNGPRVRELVADGLVQRAGTRLGPSGAEQEVWRAIPTHPQEIK